MLGWIVAIILYLLAGGMAYLMDADWYYGSDWADYARTIGLAVIWPFLAAFCIGSELKELYDKRKQQKAEEAKV